MSADFVLFGLLFLIASLASYREIRTHMNRYRMIQRIMDGPLLNWRTPR